MITALELYGYLVLTILGFVVPLMTVLLSVFQEGTEKLTSQYESERSQNEKNIKNQLKEIADSGDGVIEENPELHKNLKELKINKKDAESKLSYLNPKKQLAILFVVFLLTFIGIIVSILSSQSWFVLYGIKVGSWLPPLLISIFVFAYGLYVLWNLIMIIIEVVRITDIARRSEVKENRDLMMSLLNGVASGSQAFLKKVGIVLNGAKVSKDTETTIELESQKKIDVSVSLVNSEKRMAKNVEVGFIFPLDFMIEKKTNYTIYTDNKKQVIRYKLEILQGETNFIFSPLTITALNVGEFEIKTYISAENIEVTDKKVLFKVI